MKKILFSFSFLYCAYKAFAFEASYGDERDFCIQDGYDEVQGYYAFQTDCTHFIPNWNVKTYLAANAGRGIGYNANYASLGALINFKSFQDHSIQRFIDARCHFFNDNRWAINLGIGARAMNPFLENVYGYNVFYDYRQRPRGGYHQVGFGLELLGCNYDIRLNGYLPIGRNTRESKSVEFTYLPHDYIAIFKSYHKALGGMDAEFAAYPRRLLCMDPFIACGAYYYHKDCGGNIAGGKLRLGVRYLDYMSIEVRASYDSTFRTRVQGVFSISIPFGSTNQAACQNDCCNIICQRLIDWPVQRQEIIVEGKKRHKWKTNY